MPVNLFSNKPFYNADETAQALQEDDIQNVYLEPSPDIGFTTTRRPGYVEFADLATGYPGDGIFWWDAKQLLIAVSGGKVYTVDEDGNATSITASSLLRGNTVRFAPGQRVDGTPFLYMANGRLVYSDDGGSTATPATFNAPTTATEVAWINGKFLANTPNTNQFLFTDTDPVSGVIEPDYWAASENPLTAEAKGDDLLALRVVWQEVYVWGQEGNEIWQDTDTGLVPIPGNFSEIGLEARHSIVQAKNTLFALCVIDGKRVVIQFQGRSPVVISEDIENILASYSTVDDAIGSLIGCGGIAIYLLTFPTEGKTWAYDYKNQYWSPWSSWDDYTGTFVNFIPRHACFAKPWNKTLMMSRVDGKIYEISRDYTDDDGTTMVSYRRTPYIDHGNTLSRKRCDRVDIKAKSGVADDSEFLLRFRDDNETEWQNNIEISASPRGRRSSVTQLNRMGIYTSRQYEIRMSDDTQLVVTAITENISKLRN